MKPVKTRDATADFSKPNAWDDNRNGPCGTLSVRVESKGDYGYFYSTWRPTEHEIWALDAGGVVVLTGVGGQPPGALSVELGGKKV